jgi:tetratricopeptide (TPR) repeat protein
MPIELKKEIYSAIINANRELSRFHPNPEKGLKYLEPYFNIEVNDGIEKLRTDTLMALYSAVVADCYREKRDFASAVLWYQRASTYKIFYGFANLYAEMVIRNKLSDYYEHALMCLEQGHKLWRSKSLYTRIHGWLTCLAQSLKYPWNIPQIINSEMRSKSFVRKLKLLTTQKLEKSANDGREA